MKNHPKILVYGYGNPGRQDDGLGVKLSEEIEKWAKIEGFDFIHVDSNYQLNIEDAVPMSDKDLVIFADASQEDIDQFIMNKLTPDSTIDFTMHHVSPKYILYLCNELNNSMPLTYILHIKGYNWEFLSDMTDRSKENLEKAIEYLKKFITDYISEFSFKQKEEFSAKS